jgi:glycosyltransferase involved in cell wall biosynthesis
MKMHVVFVEPAQYTLDLEKNIYSQVGITFLYSNSKAVASIDDSLTKAYYCDKNSWFQNLRHFITLGFTNDFVISNGYNHWPFRVLFIISIFKKLHIGIESDTPYSETKGMKKIIKQLYLKTIFSKKTILGLAGGNGAHKELFLKYGMDDNRVFLMPMMIDNQKYHNDRNKRAINEIVFLYVGRLDAEKNVALLVNSFKNNFKNNNSKLIIVGAGSCDLSLKKCSEQYDNIEFKGKLFGDDLVNIYHEANVLVLPSNFEPWGLVVNEALAAGLAVVCSDAVGAATDLVINPKAGWVFESGNQEALEKLLLHCVNHPEEVAEKAQNGVNFMKNHWSYTNYKKSLEKIKSHVATH